MASIDRMKGLTGNLGMKAPVRACATTNVTLSGEQTIDGVACVAEDRVLLTGQTTASENGIYDVATAAWERSPDFDGARDVVTGTLIPVTSGTVSAQLIYQVITTGDITIGTTSLAFSQNVVASVSASGIHGATSKTPPVGADEFPIADSAASWGLKKLTFTNLVSYLSGLCSAGWNAATATTATTATNVTGTKTTVASAATPDIFATSVGQLVDYTGTATCTGFVAAPQAGMFRELYCADACLFTAGANLLIEGVPSGTTITLAAGALVQVVAITTTQFKMTYSVSGTFTGTATGLTTSPTATVRYTVQNGVVSLFIPSLLTGTSNATSFSMTGLPACVQRATTIYISGLIGENNGAVVAVSALFLTGTIAFCNGASLTQTSWTSSGSKSLFSSDITYHL